MDLGRVDALLVELCRGDGVDEYEFDARTEPVAAFIAERLTKGELRTAADLPRALARVLTDESFMTERIRERTAIALGLRPFGAKGRGLGRRIDLLHARLEAQGATDAISAKQIDRDRRNGLSAIARLVVPALQPEGQHCLVMVETTVEVSGPALSPHLETQLRRARAQTRLDRLPVGSFAFHRDAPSVEHVGAGNLTMSGDANRLIAAVEFSPPLQPGDEALYSLAWRRPERVESFGYTVYAPTKIVSYERLTITVRFVEEPELVWPIIGTTHAEAPGEPSQLHLIRRTPGLASVTLEPTERGLAYGLAWRWTHEQIDGAHERMKMRA